MKQRSNIDFSKHELTIINEEHVNIYDLHLPNTVTKKIVFINSYGVLSVTGDFGNWIFCREFHPSKNEHVSDYYWLEKLRIHSIQDGEEYDSDLTRNRINEKIEEINSDYYEKDEEDKKQEILDYLKDECLDYVDCQEWEYVSHAYSNCPTFFDSEDVPFCKSINYRLKIIFDAFDEICNRVEK